MSRNEARLFIMLDCHDCIIVGPDPDEPVLSTRVSKVSSRLELLIDLDSRPEGLRIVPGWTPQPIITAEFQTTERAEVVQGHKMAREASHFSEAERERLWG